MIAEVDALIYLACFLFCTGLAIVVIKKNTILMLMGIELMLNASNINLVAYNRLSPETIDGQMFALFVIIVAVCETAVGLALILRVYQYFQTSVPDEISDLKG